MNVTQHTVKSLRSVIMIGVALGVALIGNLAYGQWVAPAGAPTTFNVPAPVNVGGDYQIKTGDLGATRVRTDQYCDANGSNCFDAEDVVDLITAGPSTGAGSGPDCVTQLTSKTSCSGIPPFMSGAKCPSGYSEVSRMSVGNCNHGNDTTSSRVKLTCKRVVCS